MNAEFRDLPLGLREILVRYEVASMIRELQLLPIKPRKHWVADKDWTQRLPRRRRSK